MFWKWERKLRTFNDNIVVALIFFFLVALIFNFIFACKNSPVVLLILPQVFWCGFVLGVYLLLPHSLEHVFIEWSFKCQVLF